MTKKVFISSTSEDLKQHREAVCEVVLDLTWMPVMMEHFGAEPTRSIRDLCKSKIESADLFLSVIAWRRGWVPPPEQGGNGSKSITQYEVEAAEYFEKPMLYFLADDQWPVRLSEDRSEDREAVKSFREGLGRSAIFFPWEQNPSLPTSSFKALVRQELVRQKERYLTQEPNKPQPRPRLRLRHWAKRSLPSRPYPLLLPYDHPGCFAGRDREIRAFQTHLETELPIVTLFAASGSGKSSFLGAGLVPALRESKRPVAYLRRPADPDLATRLVADLVEPVDANDDLPQIDESSPTAFIEVLLETTRLAGTVPILVLDQFEDLMRDSETAREARAAAGVLLAASSRRQPGEAMLPCRWLLAYRRGFHGQVCDWLEDVLQEARALSFPNLAALPADLSHQFQAKALPLFGTGRGTDVSLKIATDAFLAAIETPLSLTDKDGKRCFPWFFVEGASLRLAEAFANARIRQPKAPLVPELQVVLADVLRRADDPGGTNSVQVSVPPDLNDTIHRALENHLLDALGRAFADVQPREARIGKSRTLLALRELADAEGRRCGESLPAEDIEKAIGDYGKVVLRLLSAHDVRILVEHRHKDQLLYGLSHDRMAAVVTRLVREEEQRGGPAIDDDILALRGFVHFHVGLFQDGGKASAISVAKFRRIARHQRALLLDEQRREWWAACRIQQGRQRRRKVVTALGLLLVAALLFQVFRIASTKQRLSSWGLPDQFYETLPRVTGLDVGTTQVTEWSWLTRARRLSSLSLSTLHSENLDFKDLPREVAQLAVDLSDSQVYSLANLPPKLSKLELDLNGSQISSLAGIPSGLSQLTIRLGGSLVTSLEHFPSETEELTLDLRHSLVTELRHLQAARSKMTLDLSFSEVRSLMHLPDDTPILDLALVGSKVENLEGLPERITSLLLKLDDSRIGTLEGLPERSSYLQLQLGGSQITNLRGMSAELSQLSLVLFGSEVTDLSALNEETRLALYLDGHQVKSLEHVPRWVTDLHLRLAGSVITNLDPDLAHRPPAEAA